MTAATRKPRALRPYRIELRLTIIPDELFARVTTEPLQHPQGDVVVMATSKAAAARRLEAVGFWHCRPAMLEEGCGNHVEVLTALGVLAEDGDVAIWRDGHGGGPVARLRPGQEPEVVADFAYDHHVYARVATLRDGTGYGYYDHRTLALVVERAEAGA